MTIDVTFGRTGQIGGQLLNPALLPGGARDSMRSAAAGAWTARGSVAADNAIVVKANVSAWLLFGTGTDPSTPPAAPAGNEATVWPISADETIVFPNPAAATFVTWRAR